MIIDLHSIGVIYNLFYNIKNDLIQYSWISILIN